MVFVGSGISRGQTFNFKVYHARCLKACHGHAVTHEELIDNFKSTDENKYVFKVCHLIRAVKKYRRHLDF